MEHYDWNEGWLFTPTFDPALVRPECPELSLTPVRLPHTVKPLPYNYCNENDYQRLCGDRREFFAPKEWLGRTVLLTFGAVAHDATVFCNGRRMFHHGCGYTAFTVDLTGALRLGQKNVVAVRCDSREDLNIPPFGGQLDALTYGGIYRAVSLDIKDRQKTLAHITEILNEKWGEGTVTLTITQQYRNMKEIIDTCPWLITLAEDACRACGVTPLILPIRGGTDGAQLSFMGLPCPNLGTGGHAYHGPYEHITVEGMDAAVDVTLEIIKLFSQRKD